MSREIVFVEFSALGTVQQDRVQHLRDRGRNPKAYERVIRAENLTRVVIVVVADSPEEKS